MTAQSPNLKELDQRLSENEIPGIWRIPPGTRPGDAAKRLAGLVRNTPFLPSSSHIRTAAAQPLRLPPVYVFAAGHRRE